MNAQRALCSRQTIEQFLADQLTEVEQRTFENHLECCPSCRRCLDDLAAEGIWWEETRGYLSSVSPAVLEDSPSGLEGQEHGLSLFGLQSYLAPTDDPQMLGRLGGYEIVGVIGCGGMGIVLKALDPPLNRYVAIKVLAPQLALSGAARQRFAREAKAAATVVHDNVMAIHAVAEANGLPYFVMPYVPGPSLEKRLRDTGALAVVEILRIGMQIASGLAAAHAQGLVHRDIKPANILLEEGTERVRITDFGLARAVDDASLTRAGVIAGTPQYMSPEQAAGNAVDHRSDLFSLGSVLYALCTGQAPFRADSTLAVLRRVEEDRTRPIREINPDIPDWLAAIVQRLHAKQPADRFQSAAEVAGLLEGFLAHLQQPTTTPAPCLPRAKDESWPEAEDVKNGGIDKGFLRLLWIPALFLLATSLVAVASLFPIGFASFVAQEKEAEDFGPSVVFVKGFFNQEQNEDRVWRWLGDGLDKAEGPLPIEGIVKMRNTRKDMFLKFVADVPVYAMREAPTVQIIFNGESLEQFVVTKRGVEKTFKVPAAKQSTEEYSELRIATSNFFVPADFHKNSTDARRLGLRVFKLAWSDKEGDAETAVLPALGAPAASGRAADPGKAGPQKTGSRILSTLLVGLGISLVLVLATALYVRQRRMAKTPEGAPVKAASDRSEGVAPVVSFTCSECGKNLKAKAGMAGKKVKCPHCGKAVLAPVADESAPTPS